MLLLEVVRVLNSDWTSWCLSFPPCLGWRMGRERTRLRAAGPRLRTAGTSEWSVFAVGSPSTDVVARGRFRVRGLLPLRPTLSVDTVGSGASATVSACSVTTVSLTLKSLLGRFPDASEHVVEADRGNTVALRLRDSMAALALWTNPKRLASCRTTSMNARLAPV